ncbi:hypothetical protein GCM10009304_22280 [Pseudomonas matsuisoli]|uniref:Uncharacterized protein n=1 Tax=Pseudomonas matsuisoli TaxID=1515666 RepID=A0A917UXS5_9PSED|nr:hypothetical protein GCM10009304_22280 [Pseudomonas matsuisoli]
MWTNVKDATEMPSGETFMNEPRETPEQDGPLKEVPEDVRENLEEQAPPPDPIPDPGPL